MPDVMADYSEGHLAMRIDGAPDITFPLGRHPQRTSLALLITLALQAAFLVLLIFATRTPSRPPIAFPDARLSLVFLPDSSGGGGGGGGGNEMKTPPREARIPPQKPQVIAPLIKAQVDQTTPTQFNIPVTTLAVTELPGAVVAPSPPSVSQGPGRSDGGGTGNGPGIGAGDGSGLDRGVGGGMDGGPHAPGTGAADPVPLYRAEPKYTAAAVTARVSGEVWVECIVLPDGSCVRAHVIRSLDERFGLDLEALKAAQQWRFRPGRDKRGQAVAFLVTIAVEFHLR